MKAALFDRFAAPLEVCEIPEPECPPDGVVVQVAACGVCRSDWHAWKGADPDVREGNLPSAQRVAALLERAWR